jgi:hypothetical protein
MQSEATESAQLRTENEALKQQLRKALQQHAEDSEVHKRARLAEDRRGFLERDDMLDLVFDYVGAGEYYYVAGVSRRWRGRYLKLCYNAAANKEAHKLCTSYSSALVTANRLQLALRAGLKMAQLREYEDFSHDVVYSSLEPIAVLTLAKTYDMPWPVELCTDAAYSEDVELLKWLHERQCPWNESAVLAETARNDAVEMLKWLQSVTEPWSQAVKDSILWDAGWLDALDAVKWLTAAGAQWPSSFYGTGTDDYGTVVNTCWSARCVQWALAQGCDWGKWKCLKLAAKRYCDVDRRE